MPSCSFCSSSLSFSSSPSSRGQYSLSRCFVFPFMRLYILPFFACCHLSAASCLCSSSPGLRHWLYNRLAVCVPPPLPFLHLHLPVFLLGAVFLQLSLHCRCTVVKADAVPEDWTLKLITLNSFLSTATGTSENRQYQVSSNIVKAALTLQSTAYNTAAAAKVYAGHLFTYLNDGDGGANRISTLDFKLNNIVIPNKVGLYIWT